MGLYEGLDKLKYVFAISNYVYMGDEEYYVIYIAPEKYWNEVGDLNNYQEVNEGELEHYLVKNCGDILESWDIVHWYATTDEEKDDIEELLESIGMTKSQTLQEYADNEVQDFGDQYIAELY